MVPLTASSRSYAPFFVEQQAGPFVPPVVHLCDATSCAALPWPTVAIVVLQPLQRCFSTRAVGLITPLLVFSVRVTHSDLQFMQAIGWATETDGAGAGVMSFSAPPLNTNSAPCSCPATETNDAIAMASPVSRASVLIRDVFIFGPFYFFISLR